MLIVRRHQGHTNDSTLPIYFGLNDIGINTCVYISHREEELGMCGGLRTGGGEASTCGAFNFGVSCSDIA